MEKLKEQKYRAISIRYKPSDWDVLKNMMDTFQEMTGIVMTRNKFIKMMCCDGFTSFIEVAKGQEQL